MAVKVTTIEAQWPTTGGGTLAIQEGGIQLPTRGTLNFGPGIAAVDNPDANRIDVTVEAGVLALDTKRVTLPIGSDGNAVATTASLDLNQRTLMLLPVTTSRWRLRVRNASALTDLAQTGAITITGAWLGTPLFSGTGIRWGRTFTGTPSQAVASFSTPSDGSEVNSDWVTDPALQFREGTPAGLSIGMTRAGSGSHVHSLQGWTYSGSGAAAAAGSASPAATLTCDVTLDIRVEYEFQTVSGQAARDVGVVIGDSIAAGWMSDTINAAASPPQIPGWDPHEAWPGVAGIRNGFAWINMGIGSTRASQWATHSGWKWDRCDLATVIPDFAIISLGTNDVFDGDSLATMQAHIQSVVSILSDLGIKEIYLGTAIPRNYGATPEGLRTSLNNWMRTVPCGAAAVFDFDKATYLQATPAVMDSDWVGSVGYPHPNRAGHQKMGAVVTRLR